MLKVHEGKQRVVVITATGVYCDTRRLVHTHEIVIFADYLDFQVQHWWLNAIGLMHQQVVVAHHVLRLCELIVDSEPSLLNRLEVVFLAIRTKLIHKHLNKLPLDPPLLAVRTELVVVGSDKPEWSYVLVVRRVLSVKLHLHN